MSSSKRKNKTHSPDDLEDHYQSGHMIGYWSEAPWDFDKAPKRYKTPRGAFRRGIIDGVKLRRQHRRRVKEILANPRRMIGDSETLQLLSNELTRIPANQILESQDERATKVAEILVKAGAR